MTATTAIRLDGIEGAQVLSVKPGDVVVLMTDDRINPGQREYIAKQMAKAFPDGVKLMILDGGAKIAVISPTQGNPGPL
jgi:pyruvate kinase